MPKKRKTQRVRFHKGDKRPGPGVRKKLSYKVKEYYYSKLSNVKRFNLDYETFFLEFKDKLLSE